MLIAGAEILRSRLADARAVMVDVKRGESIVHQEMSRNIDADYEIKNGTVIK